MKEDIGRRSEEEERRSDDSDRLRDQKQIASENPHTHHVIMGCEIPIREMRP